MLRIIAALAFTSAGGIMGFSMADKLKEARKICDDISSLFQRASFLIGYRCDDVYAVCRNLKADSEFKNLTFLQYLPDEYTVSEDFHICWNKALELQKNLGKEEKELLMYFGSVLGKSDVDGQLSSISEIQKELERISAIRLENLHKKGRLYRSTGLLFGVMAGILVI
ncbi:MAG: stage III sporulation protein AB [Ruminococcus sp.]|nr:stage III sporulation protein AB [Ruminococcus sp.]MDE7104402.1 stage III sporulation protein AB [Ruminococcus sp.]